MFIAKSNGNSFGIGGGCATAMVGVRQFDGERWYYEDAVSARMGVFQQGAF